MLRGIQLFAKVIFFHLTVLGGERQRSEIRYIDDIHASIDTGNKLANKVLRNGLYTNTQPQKGIRDASLTSSAVIKSVC